MSDGQALPAGTRLMFFCRFQQAADNVSRHAGAGRIEVVFKYDSRQIELMIREDGCGFELPSTWETFTSHGCNGLAGMAARAASR